MRTILFLSFAVALNAQMLVSGINTGDQIDATLPFTDIATNNASTSKHGFLPKLSGSASDSLKGDGTWGGVSAAVAWGAITGTLSSQPDLQTALNAKAATASLATVATTGVYSDLTGKPTLGTAAATNSTAYEVPLTFSTGLTRTVNTVTVNTSQNIATLSNLTSNGFVKTGGAAGTLSIDTVAYAPLASPTFTGTVVLPASTSLTTPVIGVATGTSLAATGLITSSGTAGIGYATGAGGTVTQGTNRTTGVTLNKTCGAITLISAAGSTTFASFTVTNSTVAATDVPVVVQKSGTDLYEIHVTAVAAGSFRISYKTTGGTTTEQPVFSYVVLKAVSA